MTAPYRFGHAPDLDLIFVVGDESGPPEVEEMADGNMQVDLRPRLKVPSADPATWSATSCATAYEALAKPRFTRDLLDCEIVHRGAAFGSPSFVWDGAGPSAARNRFNGQVVGVYTLDSDSLSRTHSSRHFAPVA
jgi:hypothetical protein